MSGQTGTSLVELIIYAFPFLIGLLAWALVEVYNNLKVDIRESKTSLKHVSITVTDIQTKLLKVQSAQKFEAEKLHSLESLIQNIHKKTGDTTDLKQRVNTIGRKLKDQEESHGRVIVVLKRVIEVINSIKKTG